MYFSEMKSREWMGFLLEDIWLIPLKCYTPEIHRINKLKFHGTIPNEIDLSIWIHFARYQGIWVSRFGGLSGCIIFSGNCHKKIWNLTQPSPARGIGRLFWKEIQIRQNRALSRENRKWEGLLSRNVGRIWYLYIFALKHSKKIVQKYLYFRKQGEVELALEDVDKIWRENIYNETNLKSSTHLHSNAFDFFIF